MKILLVEDDNKIVSFLQKGLKEEGYSIDIANEGMEGYYLATTNNYDLILLDIMLPKLNGNELCKNLRDVGINTPIIMLSARDSIEDKISGLDIGANDYIAKPFSFAELLARIRVQLRLNNINNTKLSVDDLELDILKKTAIRAGKSIVLTVKEFALLELLIKNKDQVLSETYIKDTLSNFDDFNSSNIVNVYIYRLRNKIDKAYDKKLIKTVRGLGFSISEKN